MYRVVEFQRGYMTNTDLFIEKYNNNLQNL